MMKNNLLDQGSRVKGRASCWLMRACLSTAAILVTGVTFANDMSVWHQAAAASSVPVRVLHGIALVESGRTWSDGTFRPWPWTLNSSARGSQFFLSRAAAESELRALIAEGVTNIDIGMMQVNCGYHCERVSSPFDLLDPKTNVLVAAQILAEYKVKKGDLASTVGAYHAGLRPSREPRSRRYQDLVAQRVRGLTHGSDS